MVRGQAVSTEKKTGERRALPLHAEADIHNRFDIEVIGQDGKITQKAVAHNIILNAMWTRMFGYNQWFGAISYGSGTGTLSAARTDLFTRIGTKAAGTLTVDTSRFDSDGIVSFRKQIQIGTGEITGQTLREVGISYDTNANHAMTHALLRDMNGNAVSITVGALDVINIYATVFVRFNKSGYEGGNVRFLHPKIGDETNSPYSLFYTLAGVGRLYATPGYAISTLIVFNGEPPIEFGAGGYTPTNYPSYIGSKTGLYNDDAANKKFSSKWSLAAGATYRIGAGELNPTDGGGWRGARTSHGGSNAWTEIAIEFPNNAKPYCAITDEAVGTGTGSALDFPLKFGFVMNDGSASIKANGVTIDPANYTIEYNKPPHNKIGYFLRHVVGSRQIININNAIISGAELPIGAYQIIENPYYSNYGITSFYRGTGIKVEVSDDLDNWTEIYTAAEGSGTKSINLAYQKKRYWKFTSPAGQANSSLVHTIVSSDITANSLHFAAGQAPAAGAAITASYRTASIPKDINHVVDIELEITLGEYTP